jgi:hypothetical protein
MRRVSSLDWTSGMAMLLSLEFMAALWRGVKASPMIECDEIVAFPTKSLNY